MSMCIAGKSVQEVYSRSRIHLATSRSHVRQLLRTDVSEMFSPERVSKMCEKFKLKPGVAMDLKNGFNFDLASDRKKCWETILQDPPRNDSRPRQAVAED